MLMCEDVESSGVEWFLLQVESLIVISRRRNLEGLFNLELYLIYRQLCELYELIVIILHS